MKQTIISSIDNNIRNEGALLLGTADSPIRNIFENWKSEIHVVEQKKKPERSNSPFLLTII